MAHGDCINNSPDSVNTNSQVLASSVSLFLFYIIWKSQALFPTKSTNWNKFRKKNIQSDVTQEFTQYTGMLVCFHVPLDQQINSRNYLSLHYIIFVPYNLKAISSLRQRGNQTVLVKSVCKTALKSLFWVPTCVPGFEYLPGWREFEMHFR